MAENIKMSIDLINTYKQDISSIEDTLVKSNFSNLISSINDISSNVTSEALNPILLKVNDKVDLITNSLAESFENIDSFLSAQVQTYLDINEEAKSNLEQVLRKMELVEQMQSQSSKISVGNSNGGVSDSAAVESFTAVAATASELASRVNSGEQNNQNEPANQGGQSSKNPIDLDSYENGKVGSANYTTFMNKISDAPEEKIAVVKEVYSYLSDEGYTDEQIAGIIGSMTLESGLEPAIKNPNSTATGLCQWLNSRWSDDMRNGNWSVDSQLNHLVNEMKTRSFNGKSCLDYINQNPNSVYDSTNSFRIFFEGDNGKYTNISSQYANAIYYLINNNFEY